MGKPSKTAYEAAVRLLARRERSTTDLLAALIDLGYDEDEVRTAFDRLHESGALDDARAARAYARTAVSVKGHGRLRVERELRHMGIASGVAAATIDEVFGDLDERAAIEKAIERKTRGAHVGSLQDRARLQRFLLRKGFAPADVAEVLRKRCVRGD